MLSLRMCLLLHIRSRTRARTKKGTEAVTPLAEGFLAASEPWLSHQQSAGHAGLYEALSWWQSG